MKASVEAKKSVDPKSGSDYSYMWRPAIEEHEQNQDYDFTDVMVGFVMEGLGIGKIDICGVKMVTRCHLKIRVFSSC